MIVINKDITTVTEGYILQQVNCKGVMGAGLAKSIRDKYPWIYDEYKQFLLVEENPLGKIQVLKLDENLYLVNLFSQYDYGRCPDAVYTIYEALKYCLTSFDDMRDKSLDVYIPYGLGCGLANGKWKIVSKIIDETIGKCLICKK